MSALPDHETVVFRVDDEETGQVLLDALPATHLKSNLYRIEAPPLHAYRVSMGDVVRAGPDEEGSLIAIEVTRKSGNRTLRLDLGEMPRAGAEPLLSALAQMGLEYRTSEANRVSINVPKDADLDEVVQELRRAGLVWEHADPSYDQIYPPHRVDD